VRRFTQTRDTPLRRAPLRQLLGDLADTDAADDILQGTFVPPQGVDEYFVALLKLLKKM